MTNTIVRLTDIARCFEGVIPTLIATADRNGIPNVAYVSQLHLIDERHVAVSRQFFNKTSRNLDENRRAAAEVLEPVTFEAYRLQMRFVRSETSGPLFDSMSLRIDAIASHTGMAGVFRLVAADVFEVLRAERVDGYLTEPPPGTPEEEVSLAGFRTELRGLQLMSERINRAPDLESLFDAVLRALDEYFGFQHAMILLHEPASDRLVTIASRGYGESGVGAEVTVGEGLIGTAAREGSVIRVTAFDQELRYGRAIRREMLSHPNRHAVGAEVPLPGLPEVESMLVIPLCIGDRLLGVLAAESDETLRFAEWHEGYLNVIGNQIALGIDRIAERDADDEGEAPLRVAAAASRELQRPPQAPLPQTRRRLVFYRADDAIFADDEYLIRNVPARILWRLLEEYRERGRTEFTNRELRLDASLALPELKDNLESRLILLRRRLAEKCPDVKMVPTGRGRFQLVVDSQLELVER